MFQKEKLLSSLSMANYEERIIVSKKDQLLTFILPLGEGSKAGVRTKRKSSER